jgi:putative salt-induced outer membrane protein YdiY
MEGQIVFKLYIFRKSIRILSTVLIILLLGNTFAFAEDKDVLIFNDDYFVDSLSINQSNKNESATISSTNSLNSQSQNVNLRSAHKYLGYATALLAGITAATFSSKDLHEIAGYTTAGLSLITTGIGFYEYGEYFDLDEGFTGYNAHMILETLATVGFMATAALQDEKGTHAAIGGVSTAMMILPIFVVHW